MFKTQKSFYIRRGFVDSLIQRGAPLTLQNMKNNSPTRYPVILLECSIIERADGKKIGSLIEHSYNGIKNVVEQYAITDSDAYSRFNNSCNAYAACICAERVFGGVVDVFRRAGRHGDCSNGGISSKKSSLYLAGVKSFSCYSMGADDFTVCMVPVSTGGNHIALMPLKDVLNCRTPMFGGNFAFTMNSSFREFSDYPLPIHDRIER